MSSGHIGEVRSSNTESEKASMAAYKSSSLSDLSHMRLFVVVNAWCRSDRKTETWYGITQKRKPALMLADIRGSGEGATPQKCKATPHASAQPHLEHWSSPNAWKQDGTRTRFRVATGYVGICQMTRRNGGMIACRRVGY